MSRRRRFRIADIAQQVVGGFLLAGPFVVTEEVWVLAANMSWYHAVAVTTIVFAIGYGTLYKADAERNVEREAEVAGVPVRFVSLMLVEGAILASPTRTSVVVTTLKAVAVGAIFSVVGAATADSVF